jgi:RNA polymerase sigma-70 factor (family 1)
MYQDISPQTEDAALLSQLSEGSKPAFDILYDRYWKQVFNAAYKRLNDIESAKDIAQDVFVQLWIREGKKPIENLPAYLQRAARNSVFKHIEKNGKFSVMPDFVNQLVDPLRGADSGMLYREFLKAFEELIDGLPAQQRIVFKMRFEQDLSSAEIAAQLNLSPKTVRNQLGKALATLRSSLLLVQLFLLICQQNK